MKQLSRSHSKRVQQAFTLIELLVVIGIMAVMAGFAINFMGQLRQQSLVIQAANDFSRTLNETRVKAKSSAVAQEIYIDIANDRYQIVANGSATAVLPNSALTYYTMNPNVDIQVVDVADAVVSSPSSSLTSWRFFPPYGTVDAPVRGYRFGLKSNPGFYRTVRIIGVVGKIIVL